MPRAGRSPEALRPVRIERGFVRNPHGSALISFGETRVLCTAVCEERVPGWLAGRGSGWVTAEYAMLPASGSDARISRDHVNNGRALEISRLIGRSLRSIIDLNALGPRQVIVDCDVLQADGGTRTAAITGGFVALYDALEGLVSRGLLPRSPLTGECAAVSAGMIDGAPHLDLCYAEDASADVDLNLVMNSRGGIIEIQGTAEGMACTRPDWDRLLDLAETGVRELFVLQRRALGIE